MTRIPNEMPALAISTAFSPRKVLQVGFQDRDALKLGMLPNLRSMAAAPDRAESVLAKEEVDILILGPELTGRPGFDFLARVFPSTDPSMPRILVFSAGREPEIYLPWVGRGLLFFICPEMPEPAVVHQLVLSAGRQIDPPRPTADENQAQDLLGLTRRLRSVESVADLSTEIAAAIPIYLQADRGGCWIHQPVGEVLWCRRRNGEIRKASAAAGLCGFIQRTGSPRRVERLEEDALHDWHVDDPGGQGGARFLGVPVLQPCGRSSAVLTAGRSADGAPFTDREALHLSRLAAQVAAIFELGNLRDSASEALIQGSQTFRPQAMSHHARGQENEGRLLQISPGWQTRTYRLLLALVAAGALFMIFGRHYEYASGPAAILADEQLDIIAQVSSTVVKVAVEPGQRVKKGQVLAHFFSDHQAARVEAFRREINTLLLDRLRNPADQGAETALAGLQAGYELANDELERLTVRAPEVGLVGDLRIRPGQLVRTGEVMLSMIGSDSRLQMIALLPGRYRPQLAPGMALRLQIAGYPYSYQHLIVDSVDENVVAPAEARRQLDPAIADSMSFDGPVVFVRAGLSPTFESDGNQWRFHDGMLATAEARVRSERLIFTLVPGLRAALGGRPVSPDTSRIEARP